ncbi:MAG TPA: tRNA pseudouridine(55) synthase TruB [Gammaproteobacteria bacterium]|nr:tRNA pseudouridine(55) synthase TruB [Gammaproteobacteria bacterium]|tara:strand:- start:525 stop:1457 length:933 start_codon:yes stop_codon:yes gene_type:complete
MGRRRSGRAINGVLVVDKPGGISSNDAVQQVKKIYAAQKVGHTGSLDPLATGVLPLCLGEATKFSRFLLESDKAYTAQIRLGVRTDTGDADGEVVDERDAASITLSQIETELARFRGAIDQVPSMYSAIKHNGQPLYKLARQGIEVAREPRRVQIYKNEVLSLHEQLLELEIECSKGTYVRTIAEDLGEVLGCGAHVTALRRTGAGPYRLDEAVTIAELASLRSAEDEHTALDAKLMPVESTVAQWPEVRLGESSAFYLSQGQAVQVAHAPSRGWVRLLADEAGDVQRFLGVGEVNSDGLIAPRRLVNTQ